MASTLYDSVFNSGDFCGSATTATTTSGTWCVSNIPSIAPFKVGDRVLNQTKKEYRPNYGKEGTIVDTGISSSGGQYLYVTYDDGASGSGEYHHYKKIEDKNKSMIKKLSNFIKKTVNSDTQELLKAGLINGDLEPTVKGQNELIEVLWFANLDAIVARAKEINAEAEAESDK